MCSEVGGEEARVGSGGGGCQWPMKADRQATDLGGLGDYIN
jgi:hypothetical protein